MPWPAPIGDVFQPTEQGSHCYVIISEPASDPEGRVLVVNWTTLRRSCIDDACILSAGSHPNIDRDSTIAYSRAKLWPFGKIAFAIKQGALRGLPPLTDAVIQRVVAGARISPELRAEWRNLLPPEQV